MVSNDLNQKINIAEIKSNLFCFEKPKSNEHKFAWLSLKSDAYSETSQRFKLKQAFSENRQRLLAIKYFRK